MNVILNDFIKLGSLSLIARILSGLRGLLIVLSLPPQALGEYTVWLLFVFYFSILDFGTFKGLERDIPHFRAAGDQAAVKKTNDIGWSSYFILSTAASLLLGIVSFIVFKQWILALLLGGYLFFDKWYRAYDSNTRINLQYKDNGLAQIINAIVSLLLIWFLLPKFGTPAVFIGLIGGAVASIIFLVSVSPIHFNWMIPSRKTLTYLASCIPLALVAYSIEFFHAAALTILAIRWDKETLGYFAFSFRIFQIALAIFPYLIQDVMRTRLYEGLAKVKDEVQLERLKFLAKPLTIYAVITLLAWLGVLVFSGPIVHYVAPVYLPSVLALKILTLSLLPLGIAKVLGDYLCSRLHSKAYWVVFAWATGIILQCTGLLWGMKSYDISWKAPLIYVSASIVVCALISNRVIKKEL
jgi:hypothetical protein